MPRSAKLTSSNWRCGITFGVPIAGVVWAVVELISLSGKDNVERYSWWALLLASIVMLLVFALLEVVGTHGPENRRDYGWIAIVIGADGRLSTSKVQALLWTVVLAVGIAFLTGIVAFGPSSAQNIFDNVHWEQYLVLLGGPFAAAVLAKLTVVTKVQAGTMQKSVTPAASKAVAPAVANGAAAAADDAPTAPLAGAQQPKAADTVSNDDGEIDLVDTQYLVFNLVAVVYVIVVYLGSVFGTGGVDRFAFPDIPAVLLALTSASAATYVGNKTAQSDTPKITTMSPQPVTPAGDVDVLGVSLVPAGDSAPANGTKVLLEKLDAQPADPTTAVVGVAADPAPTASSVRFTMPAGFDGATVNVRVVTSGGVVTDPYRVQVAAAH
jgi:hypothetical protein